METSKSPTRAHGSALLALRHPGLSEGIRGLLSTVFETVVMVADERSLAESAERLRPELAVVDLALESREGLEMLRRLHRRCPDLKLVVLSVHHTPSVGRALLAAGADGWVTHSAIASDLLPTIEMVLEKQRPDAGGAT